MKHTIQTLKKNLTLAEVEALEKELRECIEYCTKHHKETGFDEDYIKKQIYKGILGK